MKPIPLKQLIQITPIDNKTKEKTIRVLSSLSPQKKLELTKTCWQSISLFFQSLVSQKHQQMLDEMAHGKAIYTKKDFKNAENEIFNKLLVKIDETQSKEEIETLKQQLKSST